MAPAPGGFAFAPAPAFEMPMPDEMFMPGQLPGQPIAAEELQQVRGQAVEARAYEVSAPVTHENLIEMARKMERWLKLGPADRAACILPIYYNAGFKATLLVPLLIGCSVALPVSTSPQDFERWLTAAGS